MNSEILSNKRKSESYNKQIIKFEKNIHIRWTNYKCHGSLINLNKLLERNNLYIITYEDKEYFGEICLDNFQRTGKGIILYHNKRVYEGNWIDGKRSGEGFEIFENGNKYEGQYREGKAHGQGIYYWKSGEVYDGEWNHGLKEGNGAWKGNLGETYIGEWKKSKPHGFGAYKWKNGDKYEGEFVKGLKDGQGTEFFKNGDIYTGQFINGKHHGNGEYLLNDGSKYIGHFINGCKSGFGIWVKNYSKNSNKYEGMFLNDKKNGFGIFVWESGNIYTGFYKKDERDGLGEMIWNDGSRYIGQWKKGIQNGFGTMKFGSKEGIIKTGIFENNVFIRDASQEEIPLEMKDPNFFIMMLAPPQFKIQSSNIGFSKQNSEMTIYPKSILKSIKRKKQSMFEKTNKSILNVKITNNIYNNIGDNNSSRNTFYDTEKDYNCYPSQSKLGSVRYSSNQPSTKNEYSGILHYSREILNNIEKNLKIRI